MPDLRERLFSWRSYTPLPFLAAGLILGTPTPLSIAVGFAVALIGEAIRFWGVGHAGFETRVTGEVGAPALAVSGPYAYVRNPLYVGNILIYCGFGVMAAVPWLVGATFVWFAFQYAMIVSREEEFLIGRFGESYEEFRRNVPRFLPRLTPWSRERRPIAWDVAVRSERRTFQAFTIATVLMIARLVWLGW